MPNSPHGAKGSFSAVSASLLSNSSPFAVSALTLSSATSEWDTISPRKRVYEAPSEKDMVLTPKWGATTDDEGPLGAGGLITI